MLLSDLELHGTLRVGEQRAIRLADLKVNGLVFDLNYDIIIEFTIQTLEELSGNIGAVSLPLNWRLAWPSFGKLFSNEVQRRTEMALTVAWGHLVVRDHRGREDREVFKG